MKKYFENKILNFDINKKIDILSTLRLKYLFYLFVGAFASQILSLIENPTPRQNNIILETHIGLLIAMLFLLGMIIVLTLMLVKLRKEK